MIGASNHSISEREINDYYATPPRATKELLKLEKFYDNILEPCCGEGHISKILEENGFNVLSYDIIDRGYGDGIKDFFSNEIVYDRDIITNPPYSKSLEFAEKCLQSVKDGRKVALFLKIQFLETQKRREFFKKYPLKFVYVSSNRIGCAKNGKFDKIDDNGDPIIGSAVCYAWFIWEKGYTGETILRWFN